MTREYIKHGWKDEKEYLVNYMRKKKKAAFELLGGKCVRCGFDDPRALQIDHINGDAVKERIKGIPGYSTYRIYLNILKGTPLCEYQLLCANCNWIKRFDNKEAAHKRKESA